MVEKCIVCMEVNSVKNEDCRIVNIDGNKIPLCCKHEKMFNDGELFFENGVMMCKLKVSDDKNTAYAPSI